MYYKCLPKQYYKKGKVIDTQNDNYRICGNIDFDVIYNSVHFITDSAKKTDLPVSLFFSLLNLSNPDLQYLRNVIHNIDINKSYKINDLLRINTSFQEIEGKKLIKYSKKVNGFINTLKVGSQLWEYIGEYVRKKNFPNLPSRIDSYFLFDDLKSANYYIREHNKSHIFPFIQSIPFFKTINTF